MLSLCSPRNKDGAATTNVKDDPAQDPALAPLLAISQQALRACRPLWPDPCSAAFGVGGAGLAFDDITKDGGKALAGTPSGMYSQFIGHGLGDFRFR